jgi:predicted ATPase/class 3 adenylate cyclase
VSAVPSGHVTLLFTDIEGSTRLARELSGGWPAVLADHHAILEREICARDGYVEGTAGDSFLALYTDPRAAVTTAVEVQRALAAHAWPGGLGALRVRMGLHSGVVDRLGEGFVGIDIHLAARVQGVAHGGQIVVTEPTRRLIASEFELAPLGEHRLKDFPEPERLFQVVVDGHGPDEFPPLRSAAVRPTNLPVELRPLLGRDAELAALREAILTGEGRLHTVTGLGGTGKTRLAMAAARDLLEEHEGGVWFVSLAGIREPEALLPAIAAALGVADDPERTLAEAIAARVGDRPTLVLLDNFDQLASAAGTVDALLSDAPGLRVLVTSQLPLHRERERLHRLEALTTGAAVELFGLRAAAVLPGFDLEAERPYVEQIAERVGGMPLAIELAAARVAVLTPAQLLERLDRTLAKAARGASDLEERHRSLRATLEWTYGLLGEEERDMLARMAAFAGPAPLDAVEAVADAGEEPVDALEALAGLIDASVVRRLEHRTHGVRFAMAQAVRDFAADKLRDSGDEAVVRTAHAEHVAELGEACRFWYPGHPDVARARVRALEEEQRPALAWGREHDPALHLRLVSALCGPLFRMGRVREVDFEVGSALGHHGVTTRAAAWAANVGAIARLTLGDAEAGRALTEQAETVLLAGGDDELSLIGLRGLGVLWSMLEEHERALAASTGSVALARRRGDVLPLATSLGYHVAALLEAGRIEESGPPLEELTALLPETTADSTMPFLVENTRADRASAVGDWPLALRSYARSAMGVQEQGDAGQTCWDLMGMVLAAGSMRRHELTLELHALLCGLMDEMGMRTGPSAEWDRRVADAAAAARDALGRDSAAAAMARGTGLTAEQLRARLAELGAEA